MTELQKRNTGEVVKYEPYQPLSFEEAKENLQWRIGTDEMIATERMSRFLLLKMDMAIWLL